MMTPIPNRRAYCIVGFLFASFVVLATRNTSGEDMTKFEILRNLSERIIRDRVNDPQQLAALLSTTFVMADDDLPNHFQYYATMDNNGLFAKCYLRSPKTAAAKGAILVCDTVDNDMSPRDVHKAYGESVQFRPARASASQSALHYLAVDFDQARLSFGYDRMTKKIQKVVINFDK
jgi:hypothetical protein